MVPDGVWMVLGHANSEEFIYGDHPVGDIQNCDVQSCIHN